MKVNRKKKVVLHRSRKKKKLGFPVFAVFALIFIGGVVFGGAGASLFHTHSVFSFKKPYYSPEVYSPPKGFVLGTKDKMYKIPILLYHYVEFNKDPGDTIRISLTIPRNIFEKQIQELLRDGYIFLTVSEVGEIIDKKKPMPEKPIAITFDDGYRDFYSDVLPILQFYNIKATLFVVSDFLNHSNNLTDEQLREVINSKLVEIAGHTVNHASLTSLSKERAFKEISDDKKYLEDNFGITITSFAYPYGLFDEEVVKLVKEAGYKQAVSVVRGNEQSNANRFFLSRIRPGGGTGEYLVRTLSQK